MTVLVCPGVNSVADFLPLSVSVCMSVCVCQISVMRGVDLD